MKDGGAANRPCNGGSGVEDHHDAERRIVLTAVVTRAFVELQSSATGAGDRPRGVDGRTGQAGIIVETDAGLGAAQRRVAPVVEDADRRAGDRCTAKDDTPAEPVADSGLRADAVNRMLPPRSLRHPLCSGGVGTAARRVEFRCAEPRRPGGSPRWRRRRREARRPGRERRPLALHPLARAAISPRVGAAWTRPPGAGRRCGESRATRR